MNKILLTECNKQFIACKKIGILSCLIALNLNGIEIDPYKSIKPSMNKNIDGNTK